MKASFPVLVSLTAAALICPASADSKPGVMADYLPVGSLIPGRVIQPKLDEAIRPYLEKVDKKYAELSEKERRELLEARKQEMPLDYDERLWDSRKEYEEYLSIWGNTQLIEKEVVAIGLNPEGQEDVWMVNSATVDPQTRQTMPLTLSALQYDAKNNVWISPNGTLTLQAPIDRNDKCVYGAMKGHEWRLEKSDGLTKLQEAIVFAKSPDGKSIYVFYNFDERLVSSGAQIAKGAYVLRFSPNTAKVTPIGGTGKK
ncbi:MAG: hypothetical protein LUG84_02280 [Akkermansiaceae bacterium]|nr:hypothetical protein [Akkermansiaceae bacterium]